MKKHIVSLVLLFTCFISGCEDSTVIIKTNKDSQKDTPTQNQVTQETKKQPVVYKQAKKSVKKKPPKIEEKPDQTQIQQELDLSIPVKFQEKVITDKTSNYKQQDYLPDLFADKKNQENDSVQIDGRLINKEEQESGKEKAVDGVGIGIKLIP